MEELSTFKMITLQFAMNMPLEETTIAEVLKSRREYLHTVSYIERKISH